MHLNNKVLSTVKRQNLIQPANKILIGVSGGADSMALLWLLNELKTTLGFQIHVGHINHHLRKTANIDQGFVEKFCASHNLQCTCVSLNLEEKIKQGGSVEEIARIERFKALIQIAKKTHADKIALAHHNDDLAETVLLRILRGTGLQGLQAILPERTIDGAVFIRPLLDIPRAEIENYLKENKIKFCTDPTNKQTHFFRNKIRIELLPLLENKYQKNIKQLLGSLALTCKDDYAYLREEALKIFPTVVKKDGPKLKITLAKFENLHVALKRMILRLTVENHKGNTCALSLTHILELEDLIMHRPISSIVHLPKGLCATKTKTSIDFFEL